MPSKNVLTFEKHLLLHVEGWYTVQRANNKSHGVSSFVLLSKTLSVASGPFWISWRVSYLSFGMPATWTPSGMSPHNNNVTLPFAACVCCVCFWRAATKKYVVHTSIPWSSSYQESHQTVQNGHTLNAVASYLLEYRYSTSSATASRIVYSCVRHTGIMYRMSYVQCA